ncbi:MAG: SCO family protein, partial [Actinomycetes bacterium]
MVGARTKLVVIVIVGLALIGITLAVIMRPAATLSTDAGYSGSLMPEEVPVANFALSDENGKPVSLKTVTGAPAILTFLYTSCKDICPLTAQQIRGALDQSG